VTREKEEEEDEEEEEEEEEEETNRKVECPRVERRMRTTSPETSRDTPLE